MAQEDDLLHGEVERKLKREYLYSPVDPTRRTLDKILSILNRFHEQGRDSRSLLQDIADAINRVFLIREVTIGLKDDSDGKYRYKVMSGSRPDTWRVYSELSYTYEEFFDSRHYKGTQISKYTSIFLTEDNPYAEVDRDTITHPILLTAKRAAVDDALEGDYLVIHIYGEKGELIGWMEISGMKNGKLPKATDLRWIELMALIIGNAVVCEGRGAQNRR